MRVIVALCTIMICEVLADGEINYVTAIVTVILASILEIGHIVSKEK